MQLQLKAHNGSINETVRAYAEKRLTKLERRLYRDTVVEVTLSREHNPSIRDDHAAEAVIYTKGPNIVARESAESYETAIDRLVEKLERQVKRYRDKRTLEPRRAVQRKPPAAEAPVELPGDAGGEQGEAAA
jgi:putative sigma-54 modulation protein